MIKKVLIISTLFCSFYLSAQINMELRTNRSKYITYETVHAQITIENTSGTTLNFDNFNGGNVSLAIKTIDGKTVLPKTRGVNFANGLKLPAGQTKKFQFKINEHYDLTRNTTYYAKILVKHPKLPSALISKRMLFSVKKGDELIKIPYGAPSANGKIKMLSCEILTFKEDGKRQFGLLIQSKTTAYGFTRLAVLSASVKPEVKIDARSHIHILSKTKPRVYNYWVYSPWGKVKQASVYKVTQSRNGVPKLIRDPDIGRVMVSGGILHQPGEDEHFKLPDFHNKPTIK